MTDDTTDDTPPGVRVLTDGGTDRAAVKSATATATGVTTRDIGGEEREVLEVPISSTRPDRENDEFTKGALEGMANQIRDQKPLAFQNHGLAGNWMDAIPYDQAETIGTHHDAEVVEADDGEYELVSQINPDHTHDEGTRMLKQVRDEKQAIKFSVGFKIHGYEEKTDDEGNVLGRRFTDVDLMEDSKVGIPANPDASAPVGGKDGTQGLPGYQMHPMVQMMQAVAAGGDPGQAQAIKSAGQGTTDDGEATDGTLYEEVAELSAAVGELRAELADLKDDDGDGDECSVDTDCGEGEVCVDGECVPEDEVDDSTDPDAEESADPDETDATTDAELRERIAELEERIGDGPGESRTADPTTEEPDLTNSDGEPDATDDDSDPDDERGVTDHDPLLG